MNAIDEQLAAEVRRVEVDVTAGRQAVRARVRSRHRRRSAAAVVAVVMVAVVGFALVRTRSDRDQPVVTGPGPTDQSTTTTQPASTTSVPSEAASPPAVEISPQPTDLSDGQVVTVTGAGFPVGGHSEVVAYVCDGPRWETGCDASRAARVLAAPDGTITLRIRVFHEMYGFFGWRPCERCVLRLTWNDGSVVLPPVDLPLDFASAGDAAARPALAISGHADGAVPSGEVITVTGSGFQTDQGLSVGVCLRTKLSACVIPSWGFAQADGEGNVRATGALDAQILSFCPSPSACALAVSQEEGLDPVVVLPITLLGP